MNSCLDVGCGVNPKGSVNCDLYIKDILNHRLFSDRFSLDPKAISNFVLCHAEYLPFRSGIFKKVFSSQLIEHVKNPGLMLSELIRVSNGEIIVESVHRFGDVAICKFSLRAHRWRLAHHINHLTFRWFNQATKALGCNNTRVETLIETYWPNNNFRLFTFPYVIRVTTFKSKTS